ncbi:helix-turn-helix transcriptional regulator [Vibrio maerlii]|uniref:helix-turn-helix transcriptional regulator n=1 Tax=Vibrio maerlii TaxID=2231648 RepID=UPI000E3B71D8|nr:helix-turn-helix transcriptional regulator [Vibrio maerlii]
MPKKTFYEQELERLYGDASKPNKHLTLVRQSKAFMEQYYAEQLELNDLAKAAFMSRFHYVRMFKQLYGLTPRNYLRDLRISNAKTLLKAGKSITDTCFEVGYESVTTFSTTFKKSTGYSPREFQEQYIDKK